MSINQNYFKTGHMTEENLFILRSIFNRYCLLQSSKIYLFASIDFRMYMYSDMINQDFLYYKCSNRAVCVYILLWATV